MTKCINTRCETECFDTFCDDRCEAGFLRAANKTLKSELEALKAENNKLKHMLYCMETDVVLARDKLNLSIVTYLEDLKKVTK